MSSAIIKADSRTFEPRQAKKKLLYIVHNHPSVAPGGAEVYALELYEAMCQSDEFEPMLLAARRVPSNSSQLCRGHRLTMINDDPNQYLFLIDLSEFDWFYVTAKDKSIYTKYFHEFLSAFKPDIVHIQHTLFLGYDLLRLIKNLLPATPIVYTLHEFLAICHRNGQMVRTVGNENCLEESPRRCHECFPDISPPDFFMRKRFIQSQLSLVDLFLAPSHFLLERFVDWGIPREKIKFEDYGRSLVPRFASRAKEEERPRNRFAFFGQFTEFKGVDVLLNAMKILAEDDEPCNAHLWVHGANLEFQWHKFQDEIRELLDATQQDVTMVGRYFTSDLPDLMANIDWVVVPSIWWENSPLVIQEAFHNSRPVICSDIGGMAEKVKDGVDGLHFRAQDPLSLAAVIRRATKTEGLWNSLRQGISEVYRVEDHVESVANIYRALIAEKQFECEGYLE